jgi:hypothetical protein
LNRHQGLGTEAVRIFATSDKPCVPFAKIVKHGWDFEASLKLPQFRKAMKAGLNELVRQKRVRAKKDSFGPTKRWEELVQIQPITRQVIESLKKSNDTQRRSMIGATVSNFETTFH